MAFLVSLLVSALPLLVAGVRADHAHHAFAADDAAVLAYAANGTTYFHVFYSFEWSNEGILYHNANNCARG
jgi:hypothetical protein